jgi:type I restriction enzyme R subunit
MNKPLLLTSNFAHLQEHDEQLLRLGMLAERYFPDDPNTSLLKLRQLAELLAQRIRSRGGAAIYWLGSDTVAYNAGS